MRAHFWLRSMLITTDATWSLLSQQGATLSRVVQEFSTTDNLCTGH